METYEVKTKVYKENGEFIGNSSASVKADDKEEARFLFRHGIIQMNTPKGLKIVGDLRTFRVKLNKQSKQVQKQIEDLLATTPKDLAKKK